MIYKTAPITDNSIKYFCWNIIHKQLANWMACQQTLSYIKQKYSHCLKCTFLWTFHNSPFKVVPLKIHCSSCLYVYCIVPVLQYLLPAVNSSSDLQSQCLIYMIQATTKNYPLNRNISTSTHYYKPAVLLVYEQIMVR